MRSEPPLIVVTGGLGRVASVIRPYLAARHRLRLVDRPGTSTATHAGAWGRDVEVVEVDLTAAGAAEKALAGASAVVHLAGNGNPRVGWEEAYATNVPIARAVLDAAETNGVSTVVLASSIHASGEYNRPGLRPVDPSWDPRPCCPYGLSKVAVETLGRLHAERTGASVTCLRLGLTGWPVVETRHLGQWLSDRDAAAVVEAALGAPAGFGVHFAVSANTRRHWDTTSATRELGYRPQDDAEEFAATAGPPREYICRLFGPDENPAAQHTAPGA